MSERHEISTAQLATWLRGQGAGCWWTVDDDGRLSSVLRLPCPGDELADELEKIGGSLFVVVPPGAAVAGGKVHLDSVSIEEGQARVFQFAWPETPNEVWVLAEDTVASAGAQASTV